MPLSKGLTFQDFADERDRAKRTLVRKQDNLAGVRRQRSQPISDNALPGHSPKKDYDRE
ncbi:MAG: hypothetical protein ABWZ17_08960 [Candidatus Binatia bacterium]|jgi:hypothetical protein